MKKINILKQIVKEEVQKLQKSSSPKLLKEQVEYCNEPEIEPIYHRFGPCANENEVPYYEAIGATLDADMTVNNQNFKVCNCPGQVNCNCVGEGGWAVVWDSYYVPGGGVDGGRASVCGGRR